MSQETIMSKESDNATLTDTWTQISSNIIRVNHKLTIENFSFHSKQSPSNCMESSSFGSETNDTIKWCLSAYPSGSTIANKNYFSIFLQSLKTNVSDVTVEFKFYCLDVNNAMKHSKTANYTFKPNEGRGFARFIEKRSILDPAAGLLNDDKLTIFCEVTILEDTVCTSGKSENIQLRALKTRMNNDFRRLFENQKCSDIILTVRGHDIKAHRTILAARSPKFLAMFEHDFEELKMNCLVINDTDYEVFMEMLHFIYTDEAPNLDTMTNSLLAAADKYGVETLKIMCAEKLYNSLKIDNAIDILLLAENHSVVELKTTVLDFICAHTDDIMDTVAFKTKLNAYPHVVVEILRAVNSRNKRKTDVPAVVVNDKKRSR